MATRPKVETLSPKHWKALELIEEGSLSLAEISESLGWATDTIYQLCEGNVERMGNVGALFKEELLKIQARHTERIKYLTKETKSLGLRKMNEYLRSLTNRKADSKLVREVLAVMNTLAKSTPNVEIGQFSYTKGLNPEDLVNEFRRLSSVAKSAFVGKGVSGSEQGEPGEIPGFAQRRSELSEEPPTPLLHPDE